MRRTLFFIFSLFLVSSLCINAQMKLQLSQEITGEQPASFVNNNLETNLNLELPPEVTAPGGIKDFVKGMFLLGILADVSLPFGDGFKHVAGTGFSGHVMFSYLVSTSVFLAIRAGYISFGKKTHEGNENGFEYKYEDSYSQIPILLGAYYLFATSGKFKPYIGLALGIFIQTYSYNWREDSGFGDPWTQEGDASSTGFGIVPAVGFYYILGSVMLHAAVEYAYLFSEGPTVEYDEYEYEYESPGLSKGSNYTGISQDEDEGESADKASYLSILLGISFPLGGN